MQVFKYRWLLLGPFAQVLKVDFHIHCSYLYSRFTVPPIAMQIHVFSLLELDAPNIRQLKANERIIPMMNEGAK